MSGLNQLWIADITYIRLQREFVFLAVILDKFSRKVVGWELGRTLTARLPMAALEKAIEQRHPAPGLVQNIIPIAAFSMPVGRIRTCYESTP